MAVPSNIREAALSFLEEVFADMAKTAAPTQGSLKGKMTRQLGTSVAPPKPSAPIPTVVAFPTSS